MVSGLGSDLAELQDCFSIDGKGVLKPIGVPALEKRHIKAHMRRCEPVITTNEREKGIEVPDIVHIKCVYGL